MNRNMRNTMGMQFADSVSICIDFGSDIELVDDDDENGVTADC